MGNEEARTSGSGRGGLAKGADIADRLVILGARTIRGANAQEDNLAGRVIVGQMIRCATSPASESAGAAVRCVRCASAPAGSLWGQGKGGQDLISMSGRCRI